MEKREKIRRNLSNLDHVECCYLDKVENFINDHWNEAGVSRWEITYVKEALLKKIKFDRVRIYFEDNEVFPLEVGIAKKSPIPYLIYYKGELIYFLNMDNLRSWILEVNRTIDCINGEPSSLGKFLEFNYDYRGEYSQPRYGPSVNFVDYSLSVNFLEFMLAYQEFADDCNFRPLTSGEVKHQLLDLGLGVGLGSDNKDYVYGISNN